MAVELPGAKRAPKLDLTNAKVLLYGPPKIGKTTLASRFPGVWFFATEEGHDWVECREPTRITSWDDFLEYCAYIEEHKPTHFGDGERIRTLVFDTTDALVKLAMDHVCMQLGVGALGDLEWGKGWSAFADELQRVFTKISRWPYGLVFISHSKEKEIRSKAKTTDRIEPSIMNTGLRVVHALCDIILYAFMNEVAERDDNGDLTGRILEQRVLQCQPQNNLIAGDRTGALPTQIEMSYDVLLSYYPDTPSEEEDAKDPSANADEAVEVSSEQAAADLAALAADDESIDAEDSEEISY